MTILTVPTPHGPITGELTHAHDSRGFVVIAHVDDLHSPSHRQQLSQALAMSGLGVLNLDLVTGGEERFPDIHANVPLLAQRLAAALDTLQRNGLIENLRVGLYGASHGSPVVTRVAALRDALVRAVVCVGGLIDLAGMQYLTALNAPLLMVAGEQEQAIRQAAERVLPRLPNRHELHLVPQADGQWADPEHFAQLCRLTGDWFKRYLLVD